MPPQCASRVLDTGDYLRRQLNLPAGATVSLWSLPEPAAGEKPTTPLPMLIKLAIHGSTMKMLTLQEIYKELASRFQWFHEHKQDKAWKNSIRHNLSLNKVFKNLRRPHSKAGYWALNISGGEGHKRPPKRRRAAPA
ncbi:hypothetical protein B0H14DRAFT_2398206 [Mycena olivaceomarginata]|nr:hypothetical protein B0H14DRAFT_2398206 [Mycena olivaceomarginata]